MKKAIIINPYWDTMGGGERYVSSFVRLLLSENWQVDIRWPGDISAQIQHNFGLDISAAVFLPQQNNLKNYDLVFWVSDGSLPVSLAKKTFIHLQFPFKNIGGRSLANLIKSRFYTFIVNSEFTKKYIDREFAVNSRVIYPPVSVDDFSPGVKDNLILYVGRFSSLLQQKGQDILLSSFRHLSPQLPGWRLVLAGGTRVGFGPDGLSKLQHLARGLPVEFVLDPNYSALRQLYARAKIFWSASGYSVSETKNPLQVEHFGISLVEAMSAGCVPLVVAKGGYPEIITSGTDGYLWQEISELESFTRKIIADPQYLSTLSEAAMKKSRKFSIIEFNRCFKDLI